MRQFLEVEKKRQTEFKLSSHHLSPAAGRDGVFRGKPRPFCLPIRNAAESLYSEIRSSALDYFDEYEIKWHQGGKRRPSNHMCDSQVCAINFLFPFATRPEALAELLRFALPQVSRVVEMETPGLFLAFEWIGVENYLRERLPRHGQRKRGALFTSADAAVMYETRDAQRQIALIEWKYTEAYSTRCLRFAPSGTDRTTIYAHLFRREDCPLKKSLLPDFELLFYEPFYQLMRQQFLADEMERANELGAEEVRVLHIAPRANREYLRITSPGLAHLGNTCIEVWDQLVGESDKFVHVCTEDLFAGLALDSHCDLKPWWEYVTSRYQWVMP